MADVSALEGANVQKRLGTEDGLWWVLIDVDQSSAKTKVGVLAEGGTDLKDMMTYLSDSAINYGIFVVKGVDTRGAVTSTRTKYVFFQWVGPNVPKMKTAKAIPVKAAVGAYFQGHHLALELYDRMSLDEADIEAKLRASGGAHQPNEMVFPGGGAAVKFFGPAGGASSPTGDAAGSGAAAAPAAAAAFPKAVTVGKGSADSASNTPRPTAAADDAVVAALRKRVAELEVAASSAAPADSDSAALRARVAELEARVEELEASEAKLKKAVAALMP